MSDHGHQKSGRRLPSGGRRVAQKRDSGKSKPKPEKAVEKEPETKHENEVEQQQQPGEVLEGGQGEGREGSLAGNDEEQNGDQHEKGREEGDNEGNEGQEQQEERMSHDDGTASQLEYPEVQEISPEDFDTKSFVSCVSQLSGKIHSDNVRKMEDDFDEQELAEMVGTVTVAMNNFRSYAMHSQMQLEKLREDIKDAKDRMLKKVQSRSYDAKQGERVPVEERQLDAKVQALNKELAKAAEELARAQQVSIESEAAAAQSALLAEQAAEEAEEIQKEFEARKEAEAEARRAEEKRRQEEERRKEEEARRMEEEKKREEARRARLRKDEVEKPEWEDWPTFTYHINKNEFDHGIACLVRGDPDCFRENMISCKKLDQDPLTLVYEEQEELVSNIIRVECSEDLQKPIQVLVPHCTSRVSAMSREPVIKVEAGEGWKAIKTKEVHLDDHRDVKLVQGELTTGSATLAVVTRFKKDYLMLTKKTSKSVSAVDPRVGFTAPRGAFQDKEHFVLQMQPVDSATVHEAKKKQEASDLLTTSSICTIEWTSTSFEAPLTVTLPVQPNPVKAKKAAAARAAKEAKMKNQQRQATPQEEEAKPSKGKKKQTERKKTIAQVMAEGEEQEKAKPTKWYMGQYGASEDDENDALHFLYFDAKSKWQVLESVDIEPIRLDVVEFQMHQPIAKFIVVRTRPDCDSKSVIKMVELLTRMLEERVVNFIVRQRTSDPRDLVAYVTAPSRVDKLLDKLRDEGYGEGPEESMDIVVQEGQRLGINFRANLQAQPGSTPEDMIYNSQLDNHTTFEVTEVDKFLQKNYDVYRGYVQLVKKTAVVCAPPQRKKSTVVEPSRKKSSVLEPEPSSLKVPGKDDAGTDHLQYNDVVLYEHLIGIPKDPEEITPQPIQTAPVIIRNRDDPITPEVLQSLAGQLGDEWHRLATHLNIKKARVQAILRNCTVSNKTDTEAKYLMMLTWLKRIPKGVNKVATLCDALSQADREDLAIEVEEIDAEFHNQRKGIS